jgi:hypothetical protein
VNPNFRSDGKGKLLYSFFESEVVKRFSKNIRPPEVRNSLTQVTIRIPIKHCIQSSTPFWNKNGFMGDKDSPQLSKFIYF